MAQFLVASVEDQVPAFAQLARLPLGDLFVQELRGTRHLARADVEAAELTGDLGDLAGRDALDVHLGHGEHKGTLASLPALRGPRIEGFGALGQVADAGDLEVELAQAGLRALGPEAVRSGVPGPWRSS